MRKKILAVVLVLVLTGVLWALPLGGPFAIIDQNFFFNIVSNVVYLAANGSGSALTYDRGGSTWHFWIGGTDYVDISTTQMSTGTISANGPINTNQYYQLSSTPMIRVANTLNCTNNINNGALQMGMTNAVDLKYCEGGSLKVIHTIWTGNATATLSPSGNVVSANTTSDFCSFTFGANAGATFGWPSQTPQAGLIWHGFSTANNICVRIANVTTSNITLDATTYTVYMGGIDQ